MRHDEEGSFDETLTKYKHALEKLASFGIRISGASRLCGYQRRIEAFLKQPGDLLKVSEADRDKILFDFREMDELILIMESFTDNPTSTELERLRLLPGGTENPDDESSAKARDAQFELFLRAMFVQADIGIEMGSPDLFVSDGQVTFPLEAKRPGSSRRVDDRLRSGINQLQRQESYGVIAISLDHVIRPRGGYLVVGDHTYLASAVSELFADYFMANLRRIAERLRGKSKVSALLFILRIPARVSDTNLALLGSNIHIEPLSEPGLPDYEVVQALLKILGRVHI